jgi:ferredoxin
MKTEFSLAQLADPDIKEADKILRACVHCGFCTATCPTYVLLGDELDSPRGRIYLIKEMLEKDKPPTADVVKHIDRCLSCLACMTTCPSGVNYMHLVDQARVRIERDYQRPLTERLLRSVLSYVLPRPGLFRISMILAGLARPVRGPAADAVGRCVEPGPAAADQGNAGARAARPAAAWTGPSGHRVRSRSAGGAAGSRCCKAAPSRCWRRASTRRPSTCSPATASRSCWSGTSNAAARSPITSGHDGDALARARANVTSVAEGSGRQMGSTPSW